MALGLEDKKSIVADVNEAARNALSAVIADYRGLTVEQMTTLRREARSGGVYLKVVRNTLARRAVEGTEYACLKESFSGPTVLAFSQEDPGSAARVMKAFAKENEALEIIALSIGGQLLDGGQIDVLANMPNLDQARAMLMSVMMAPVTKLARTLNEFPARVTRVMSAVADEKKKTS